MCNLKTGARETLSPCYSYKIISLYIYLIVYVYYSINYFLHACKTIIKLEHIIKYFIIQIVFVNIYNINILLLDVYIEMLVPKSKRTLN